MLACRVIKRLESPATRRFWEAELDDVVLTIRSGPLGGAADESTVLDDDDELPLWVRLDELVREKLRGGYDEAFVDDLLDHIEGGHDVRLLGRARRFFESQEYRRYQGKTCKALDCTVDFTSRSVQGNFTQSYRDDRGQPVALLPLASRRRDGREDEQQWIGFDASNEDGPIYALFTSGDFEEAYPTLDAFLADLG